MIKNLNEQYKFSCYSLFDGNSHDQLKFHYIDIEKIYTYSEQLTFSSTSQFLYLKTLLRYPSAWLAGNITIFKKAQY